MPTVPSRYKGTSLRTGPPLSLDTKCRFSRATKFTNPSQISPSSESSDAEASRRQTSQPDVDERRRKAKSLFWFAEANSQYAYHLGLLDQDDMRAKAEAAKHCAWAACEEELKDEPAETTSRLKEQVITDVRNSVAKYLKNPAANTTTDGRHSLPLLHHHPLRNPWLEFEKKLTTDAWATDYVRAVTASIIGLDNILPPNPPSVPATNDAVSQTPEEEPKQAATHGDPTDTSQSASLRPGSWSPSGVRDQTPTTFLSSPGSKDSPTRRHAYTETTPDKIPTGGAYVSNKPVAPDTSGAASQTSADRPWWKPGRAATAATAATVLLGACLWSRLRPTGGK